MQPGSFTWSSQEKNQELAKKKPGSMTWSTPPSVLSNDPSRKGYLSTAYSGITSGTSQTWKDRSKQSFSIYGLRDSSTEMWRLLFDSMDAANDKFTKGVSDLYGKDKSAWERWGGATQAGIGLATAAFTPVSTVLKGAEAIPGVGYVAAGINSIFSGIGQGAGDTAVKALYSSNLSDETKKKLEPTVREAAGIVAQIAIGYKGAKYTESLKTKTSEIIDVAKQEVYAAQRAINTRSIPIKSLTPSSISLEGYGTKLPTIEWGVGKKDTSGSPIIEVGDTTPTRSGPYRYVPEKSTPETPVETRTAESTGNIFQSKTGLDIAREQGLRSDIVPWQERRPNQFASADAFVAADPIIAERSLTNPELVPKGLYVEEVYGAFRKKYDAEGNYAAAQRLIQSGVPTEAGRRLEVLNRSRAFDPSQVSLTDAIQEIVSEIKLRTEKETKVDIQSMSEKIKTEGEVRTPKLKSWDELIKSLEC